MVKLDTMRKEFSDVENNSEDIAESPWDTFNKYLAKPQYPFFATKSLYLCGYGATNASSRFTRSFESIKSKNFEIDGWFVIIRLLQSNLFASTKTSRACLNLKSSSSSSLEPDLWLTPKTSTSLNFFSSTYFFFSSYNSKCLPKPFTTTSWSLLSMIIPPFVVG